MISNGVLPFEYLELLTVILPISQTEFKPNFSPTNFDDIQLNEPFADEAPVGSPTWAAAGAAATPQAIATAFITALGLTPTTVTPGNTTNDTSENEISTGGNLDQDIGQLFSPNKLPADVKERFIKAKSSNVMLTKTDRSAYLGTQPNIAVDPSGNTMRKVLYHMDGPHRLINRSGELFYFSKYDEKNSKTFMEAYAIFHVQHWFLLPSVHRAERSFFM